MKNKVMDYQQIVLRAMPPFASVRSDIEMLRLKNPGKLPDELSRIYSSSIRKKYVSAGVATALPGVFPGLGTAAQIAMEAGAISADLILMLRWMAALCYGTALIYGNDIEKDFEDEFTLVLGIWAGVALPGKTLHKGEKMGIRHFDKHIADRMRNRMNQKIWQKIAVKYGAKRGGATLGRLVPFGVGAVIGGTFNYITMEQFGKSADTYFKSGDQDNKTMQ
ncbi:EcsC family protein [uncultured Flavobacterium sp.]|uniref:EcsC family protein n=1 Tax=uncultured Flavobacterium sp. TaxID=165435 RepID=UPI0025F9911C|nr:EcsC family protein [uncultured Flavobacterium sp.]